MDPSPAVVALVPAYQEAFRIASTIRALLALDDVGEVIVVDDGSTDTTRTEAARAGATVLCSSATAVRGRRSRRAPG